MGSTIVSLLLMIGIIVIHVEGGVSHSKVHRNSRSSKGPKNKTVNFILEIKEKNGFNIVKELPAKPGKYYEKKIIPEKFKAEGFLLKKLDGKMYCVRYKQHKGKNQKGYRVGKTHNKNNKSVAFCSVASTSVASSEWATAASTETEGNESSTLSSMPSSSWGEPVPRREVNRREQRSNLGKSKKGKDISVISSSEASTSVASSEWATPVGTEARENEITSSNATFNSLPSSSKLVDPFSDPRNNFPSASDTGSTWPSSYYEEYDSMEVEEMSEFSDDLRTLLSDESLADSE